MNPPSHSGIQLRMKTAFPGRADLSPVRRIGNGQSARWRHTRPTHFRGNLHMNSGRNMKPKPFLPFMFRPEFMWARGSKSPCASSRRIWRLSMDFKGRPAMAFEVGTR
jgi:hypothetical protein